MYLKAIHLRNFRSYQDDLFEFTPGVNLICGPNAIGKTTILEAIYFLICGRSFRTSQCSDLIRNGADYFSIEAVFIKHGIEQKIKVFSDGKQRKVSYNNTEGLSLSSLFGVLYGVTLTPDDVELVKGAPVIRRQFLDIQIAQTDPLYLHHLTRYQRAMRQRNYLLKSRNLASIEVWELEMARAAGYIETKRHDTLKLLENHTQRVYSEMSLEVSTIHFTSKNMITGDRAQIEEKLLHQYERNRRREMELGNTLVGPHKDDILFSLGDNEMRYFASEGQQRTCVASLKLAEWHCLKEMSQVEPLMLFDDLGMSLDQSRKSKVMNYLNGLGQVILTATDKLDSGSKMNIIELHEHQVKR